MTLSPPAFLTQPSLISTSTALHLQTPQQPPLTHFLTASETITATPQTFEPQLPPPTLLIGMGSVLLLSMAAVVVWANEVVPVSRTKLAISKKSGGVKEYLDGLDSAVVSTAESLDESESAICTTPTTSTNDGRGFERWLFSDWLNSPSRQKGISRGGRQKEPALPILKNAKWNSGDNPVLVTAALMIVGIVFASVTERVL